MFYDCYCRRSIRYWMWCYEFHNLLSTFVNLCATHRISLSIGIAFGRLRIAPHRKFRDGLHPAHCHCRWIINHSSLMTNICTREFLINKWACGIRNFTRIPKSFQRNSEILSQQPMLFHFHQRIRLYAVWTPCGNCSVRWVAVRVSFDLRNQVAMVQWKRISFQCHVEERQDK